jgi:3-oxoacyl-[acyl-carrier-protein] synthase-3
MRRAQISGTGAYVPDRIMTNDDLTAFCDTSDEWIRKRTGIEERRMARPGEEGTADLSIPAARAAIEDAGLTPADVDAIICCTVTPDQLLPASANLIQGALGANHAASFDLNAACSGFVYGLATANAYIASGLFDNVLVIGAEVTTSLLTWKYRDTAVLFGDGAGAVMLTPSNNGKGVLSLFLASDGANAEVLHVPKGGSKNRITPENAADDPYRIFMNGQELYKHAITRFIEATNEALERAGMTLDDVDLFIPHQANARIIEAVGERLGLPKEKLVLNINKYGNTVAASIPLALHEAKVEGRLFDGANVLLVSFGAGLTWASALLRW